LLLVVNDRKAYDKIRTELGGMFPQGLPKRGFLTSFIIFDEDWRPRTLSMAGVPLRYQLFRSGTRANDKWARVALTPVFEALGIPIEIPHVTSPGFRVALRNVVIGMIAFMLIFAIMAHSC
jgi:hypothetical protein